MTGGHVGLERISKIRDRLMPMGDELVRRAHASGRLRADIETSDLSLIQAVMGPLIDASAGIEPELYRRYLDIMLRGIATAARRGAAAPRRSAGLRPDRADHVQRQEPAPASARRRRPTSLSRRARPGRSAPPGPRSRRDGPGTSARPPPLSASTPAVRSRAAPPRPPAGRPAAARSSPNSSAAGRTSARSPSRSRRPSITASSCPGATCRNASRDDPAGRRWLSSAGSCGHSSSR